ncbi:MAG: DVUA0089 family protein [Pseudomonadota bacterium]
MSVTSKGSVAAAALVFAAGPVLAQEVTCGGAAEGAAWIAGAADGSNIATAVTALSTTLSAAEHGDAATLFSLSQPMDIRVEAQGQGLIGDPLLALYDAGGTLVALDDDSGSNLASRVELDLQPGDYCLVVEGFAGSAVEADVQVSRLDMTALTEGLAGGFAGTLDLPPFVGIQPCLATTEARPLGSGAIDENLAQGQAVTDRNTVTDVPYYRFTITTPQAVSIRAQNQDADPYIYLFDGEGSLLAENDDTDGLNSRIVMTDPLSPGSYCIGMRALSDPDLPVTVSVNGFSQAQADQERFASADAAPGPGSSYPVSDAGALGDVSLRDIQVPGDRAQFVRFTVQMPGVYVITADEINDSDPWVRLFDRAGNLIGDNDDANGTLNSELVIRLEAGSYTLGVRQYSSDYNGMIRVGIVRQLPAQ